MPRPCVAWAAGRKRSEVRGDTSGPRQLDVRFALIKTANAEGAKKIHPWLFLPLIIIALLLVKLQFSWACSFTFSISLTALILKTAPRRVNTVLVVIELRKVYDIPSSASTFPGDHQIPSQSDATTIPLRSDGEAAYRFLKESD